MNIKLDVSDVTLEGDRIRLRPFKKDDLEDFYLYAKTPGLGESAGWFHHESIEDSKKILDKFIRDKNILAIEKDGQVIGSIGIHPYDEDFFEDLNDKRAVEIGFVLSQDFHRQYLMTESLELVLDYLFNDIGLDAVVGGHFRGNFKSKNIHKKFNYKYFSSHLVKTNMGTMEVTHEYILSKEDYDQYLENKKKQEKSKVNDSIIDSSNSNQMISEKKLPQGKSLTLNSDFSNILIFVKNGMIQYESKLYIGGDLIIANPNDKINLEILRDASFIIVETKIR
ncbi:GNAT family N-acetyltransferase [Anaerococcus vaginimassiliensis]|uniref:GNAT family N-acetyltransferase n=1 Tax=Anaerococcus vaginimassiliensis TaxID=2042308 RepID=UPI0010318D94|nr:GNAT family N-acetyltransferase [Anaerococcus vaginimassiliensis]